jgi:hypothetical protein
MTDRLPFLVELAIELGLPYRVVPWVTRTSAGDVVRGTVRLQVDAGLPNPAEDGDHSGWRDVMGRQDLTAAADRRRRAPVDALPVGTSMTTPARLEPGVYRGRRLLPAAFRLLEVPPNAPKLRGAVEIREVEDRRTEDPRGALLVDELTVDWNRVLDPTLNSDGAILLARIARSLLEGEPVDLRRTIGLHGDLAKRLAEAMTLAAGRTLG